MVGREAERDADRRRGGDARELGGAEDAQDQGRLGRRAGSQALGRLCQYGLADEAFALVEAADFSPYFLRGTRCAPPDVSLSALFCFDQKALRADPRFLRLCAKLGLCEYWATSGKWPDCADEVDYDFRTLAKSLASL